MKKNKQMFFPNLLNSSHRDSPGKSGSDADVFVDVESIDEHHQQQHHTSKSMCKIIFRKLPD